MTGEPIASGSSVAVAATLCKRGRKNVCAAVILDAESERNRDRRDR